MRVLGCLQHAIVNVIYHHIFARDWIANGAWVFALPSLASLVLLDVTVIVWLGLRLLHLRLGVNLRIAPLLLVVQALHELLNVGDAIGARVRLAAGHSCLLSVHLCLGVRM